MNRLRLTLVSLVFAAATLSTAVSIAAPVADALPALTLTTAWGGHAVTSDASSEARLSGEASSAAAPVTFAVDCGGQPCADLDITEVTFDFGDGTTRRGASTSVAHRYRTAGTFDATVQIVARAPGAGFDSAHATRRVTVDVATATADVVDLSDVAARDQMLQVAAFSLLSSCGQAVAGLHQVGPTRTGRPLFCPDPSAVYTAAPDGTATGDDTNLQTDLSCLDRFYLCGLDPADFAQGGSPLSACTDATCQVAGTTADATPSGVQLTYDAGRCGDGVEAVRNAGSWTLTPGVEDGCVTRAELYTALLGLVDGEATGRPLDPAVVCADAGDFTAAELYPVLRAAALQVPSLYATDPDLDRDRCAPHLPARRDEAYAALGTLLGVTGDPAAAGLRDLTDLHLGHQPRTVGGVRTISAPLAQPDAALIAGALAAGVPLPADTSCPDGTGQCLSPDTALTRGELARLIAAVVTS